jgi:hypothetical protein
LDRGSTKNNSIKKSAYVHVCEFTAAFKRNQHPMQSQQQFTTQRVEAPAACLGDVLGFRRLNLRLKVDGLSRVKVENADLRKHHGQN